MTSPSTAPDPLPHNAATRQVLSALVDGEAASSDAGGADACSAALAAWKDDADARQAWHRYLLIGDVLRSEDLARAPGDDLDFLNRLRGRLEAEPVHSVLRVDPNTATTGQPVPVAMAASSRWPGRRPAGFALAASVAVAAVALLVVKSAGPGGAPEGLPKLAVQDLPAAEAARVTPVRAVNDAGVLRDPRLDEFLRMHQMARSGLAVGVPGGSLQRADFQMPGGIER